MGHKELHLSKNLRKSILQGNPWVYWDALAEKKLDSVVLAKLLDKKGEFVGWGYTQPDSPLGLRILSLDKKTPGEDFFAARFHEAFQLRNSFFNGLIQSFSNSNAEDPEAVQATNAFRLFNGEGDLLPGLVCDVYGDIAVLQFDGPAASEYWDHDFIANWILSNTSCSSVYHKVRHDVDEAPKWWGPEQETLVEILEEGRKYYVDILHGQKTGFFLDQRDNRSFVQKLSKQKSMLNLFCYSGGFSIAAGLGGASEVTSVDRDQYALNAANQNWQLNEMQVIQNTICTDIFNWLGQTKTKYNLVVCDPPSFTKSKSSKEGAFKKYVELFASTAKLTSKNGILCLSSCSSHVNFSDFEEIVREALSKARRTGRTLRFSGQGSDHPYPHALPQMRYLKFIGLKLD